jgi:predicted membrane metal-binding protein
MAMPTSRTTGPKLRSLRPSEAFQDFVRRSLAAGAAGFLVSGALNTSDVIPPLYRSLVIVSGMEAAFFGSLTLLGAVLSVVLPYFMNFVWITLPRRSLIYPAAVLVILGGVAIEIIHRKISGPQPDDGIEEALIRTLVQEIDSKLTWVDRITWICVTVGVIILLVLVLR